MVSAKLKTHYCTVLAQTISSDGRFLFAGTNFGEIAVFSIDKIDQSLAETDRMALISNDPIQLLQITEKPLISLSLAFHKENLIVGLNGEIVGYAWSEKSQRIEKRAWEVKIPTSPENSELNEINCFWLDAENNVLYAGCGDSNIYSFNLEDSKPMRSFTGHTDYIHSLDGQSGLNQVASASEDGSVRLWDTRQRRHTAKFEPWKKDQLARPDFGKWQGTVSFNEDWLVCGGGPRFSMWHLRSHEVTTVFSFPEKCHVSGFLEENIFVGGDYSKLFQYNFNGDVVAEVPASCAAVYSVVWQQEGQKFLAIAGASNSIDICSNFTFKDIVLSIYKK